MKIYLLKFSIVLFLINNLSAQNICQVSQLPSSLQTGLIAFWPFCGNPNDVTANAYNGVVTNATLTIDRFGNPNSAYHFNSTNTRIDVPATFFDTKWNQYSISCWSKPDDLSKPKQVFFNTYPHWGFSIGMREPLNDYYGFAVSANGSTWDVTYNMVTTIAPVNNTWAHHVVVKNGNVFTYYINGNVVNTQTVTTPFTITNPTALILGAILIPSGYDYYYGGAADDYMIYNRALSPSEVGTLTNLSPAWVHEYANNINLNLYPNPNNGNFNVKLNSGGKEISLSIYNMIGQKLFSKILKEENNEINPELNSGIYFIKLNDDKGNFVAEKKLIIE